MKGKVFAFFSALIVVCMLFSCGGGSGSDSDSAQKAVAVGFDLNIVGDISKAISATDPDYRNIQFWYRAIPQWTSHDGIEIQGDTRNNRGKDANNFVQLDSNTFTYANPTGTVGYFAQGQWAFDIEVRKPLNAGGSAVLWKTAASVKQYINSEENITITVTKNIDNNKEGTVTFNVTAPKTANTDSFEVYYKSVGTAGDGTKITSGLTKGGADDASEATLTGSYDLAAGIYAITVKYYSAADTLVGASTTTAEVIPEGTVTVRGSIENNKWQQTSFTIKGMYKLTATVTASEISTKGTVTAPGTVNFTCAPTITELNGAAVTPAPTYSYEWRLNGAIVGDNSSTYEWTMTAGDANQDAYVECLVYFKDNAGKVIGSASNTFLLKVRE